MIQDLGKPRFVTYIIEINANESTYYYFTLRKQFTSQLQFSRSYSSFWMDQTNRMDRHRLLDGI